MASNRNKHDRSLMKREDFSLCVPCKTRVRNRRFCDGWMHLQLVSYHENGPVYEEYCCLKCNKTSRIRQVCRGKPRSFNKAAKE